MIKTARIINKFSNENIFAKKESELKSRKDAYSFRNINKTTTHFFFKPKKEDENNKIFSLLSTSTSNLLKQMTKQKSIRLNLFSKILNEYKNNAKYNESYYQKKQNNLNSGNNSILLITEFCKTNISKSFRSYKKINNSNIKINTKMKIKKALNNNEIEIKNHMNSSNSDSFLFRIKNNDNNLDILKYFQEIRKLQKINDNSDTFKIETHKGMYKSYKPTLKKSQTARHFTNLINIKTKQISPKRDNISQIMDKVRDFEILDYEYKVAKEKQNKYIEDYENKLNYCDDFSRNINKSEIFLNQRFLGKISDYMRFIYSKIEEEKMKEILIFNENLKLRKEIKKLNEKIKKKNVEKNVILKWIYFQIKIKEKILRIPSYYKEIIEHKTEKNIKQEDKHNKIIRMSLKQSAKVVKKFNIDGFTNRKSFKIKRALNQTSSKDLNYLKSSKKSSEKALNDININEEEIKRIKSYLESPIFNDIEELINSLEFYKNEIIIKTKDYYDLRLQIFNNKNTLIKYQNKLAKENFNFERIMNSKNKQLEEIKEINNIKNTTRFDAKEISKDEKSIFKNLSKRSKYNNNPLVIKINSIYETSKLSKIDIKIDKNRLFKNNIGDPLIIELLYQLKYVTQVVDKIVLKIRYYKENDIQKREFIKNIKNEIDKGHKNAKNLEQKIKEKERSIKLFNRIEERNSKLYFLSFRKVDKYNTIGQKKERKKTISRDTSFFNFNLI